MSCDGYTGPVSDMPTNLRPMLAKPARRPPDGPGWVAEIKWDGARAITYCQGGETELQSRLGNSLSERFPELTGLAQAAPAEELILDGEIVSFDEEGRPRFGLLQRRLQWQPGRASPKGPEATYLIFDLLYIDGRSTMSLPYEQRRELLEGLAIAGDHWQTPPALEGDIPGLLEASRRQAVEGLVLKRLGSPYRPGLRTRDWLKLKNFNRREFVVGGWLPGMGRRSGRLGSLLLGAWEEIDGERRLHYAGRVGTGFDEQWLDRLSTELEPLERRESPFSPPADRTLAPPRESVFVEPRLVVEVDYGEITSDGMLRHSAFKGLREDKPPEEVLWEDV